MKTIPLTKSCFTKVDDDDYLKFAIYRWYADISDRKDKSIRAARAIYINRKGYKVYLSRLIMKAPKGIYVDHVNHDTLDNRKCNLRLCSKTENTRNQRKRKDNTSGYKGVIYNLKKKKWRSQLYMKINGKKKRIHSEYFSTKKEAARAYDNAAKKYFGRFAKGNFS